MIVPGSDYIDEKRPFRERFFCVTACTAKAMFAASSMSLSLVQRVRQSEACPEYEANLVMTLTGRRKRDSLGSVL
ncbi:MAG: hypothetical protein HGB34_04395 [Candidatus Moranbacteria bacterium]|nr:hypothetical protein [Candidatus Moranbacteria bacterium]